MKVSACLVSVLVIVVAACAQPGDGLPFQGQDGGVSMGGAGNPSGTGAVYGTGGTSVTGGASGTGTASGGSYSKETGALPMSMPGITVPAERRLPEGRAVRARSLRFALAGQVA